MGASNDGNDASVWRPVVLDPSTPQGAHEVDALRSSDRVWMVCDRLDLQLRDLAEARVPHLEPPSAEDIDRGVQQILRGSPPAMFGRWVHYPWSGRLVHLLPPKEFRELRLDRNRNKITIAEQQRLGRTTVGIVGLSVGNAIALTLALEGSFGHLKLADFDTLELSNMNRLRAGVHELGLPKVVLAARQIFEVDPYVSVEIYPDGISEDNVDEFLVGERPLDVLVEECDSIAVKFLLRERARELGLPVLMETSDRGMLDVERFDLEPDRPLFHGLVGDLTSSDLATVDKKERTSRDRKAVIAIKILDAPNISARMAASMIEVDQTLSTWPQLGADVALGGATTAVAVRRLSLGEQLESGRRYVDLSRIVESGHLGPPIPPPGSARPRQLPDRGLARPDGDADVPEVIRFAVEHAVMAPSGGNVQPWHFWYDDDRLWVVNDRVRARNLFDRRRRASYLALGAAIENMAIAAAHKSHRTIVDAFPVDGLPDIAAAIRFDPFDDATVTALAAAYPLLALRTTNRKLGDRVPLGDGDAKRLIAAAQSRGGDLRVFASQEVLDEVARILGEADRIRFLAARTHAEVMGELRWSRQDSEQTKDGLTVTSLELSSAAEAAIHLLCRPDVASLLRDWGGGARLSEGARDSLAAASAVGVLVLESDDPNEWLAGGRAMQQTWLAATALGLALQPMTVILYMFELLDEPDGPFDPAERETLAALRMRLSKVLDLRSAAPAAMLFRLSHPPAPAERSLRLPASHVLERGRPPGVAVAAETAAG